MYKRGRIITVLFSFLLFLGLFTEVVYGKEEYTVKNYNINVLVTEDNVYEVTETMDIFMPNEQHGIYRYIPLKYDDKRKAINGIKVRNEEGEELEFTKTEKSENLVLKVGSESKTLSGNQRYIIQYKINMGYDKIEGKDLFHLNIIGNGWDAVIEKVNFSIILPKDFDGSEISIFSGNSGSTDNKKIDYRVEGRSIIGQNKFALNPLEGVTIKQELPQGYFNEYNKLKEINIINGINIASLCGAILILGLSIKLRISYILGNKAYSSPINFYPPIGMTPGEIGCVYNKKISFRDIFSYVIYWCNKGFVNIEDANGDMKIRFIKEKIDGRYFEKYIYSILKYNSKDGVLRVKDSSKFKGQEMSNAASELMKYVNNNYNIYSKKLKYKGIILRIFSTIFMIVYLGTLSYKTTENILYLTAAISFSFLQLVGVRILIEAITKIRYIIERIMQNKLINFLKLVIAIVIIVIFRQLIIILLGLIYEQGGIGITYLYEGQMFMLLIGEALFIATIIISNVGKVLKEGKGRGLYEEINGFREFLLVAEKDRLERLIKENPKYAYEMLPYAMVLGVSKVWSDKFKGIDMSPPPWHGNNNYNGWGVVDSGDSISDYKFTDGEMESLGKENTSSSWSSDSDYSGGGSSDSSSAGGGAGGGGGGVW